MATPQVYVTGVGMVTPVGLDTRSSWEAFLKGTSGIDYITSFDAEGFETRFAGEVKGFDPTEYVDRKQARRLDRFAQLAVAATHQALDQAGPGAEQRRRRRHSRGHGHRQRHRRDHHSVGAVRCPGRAWPRPG